MYAKDATDGYMKTLYKHQERFLAKNPDRALLLWEAGSGKSLAACEWLKKRPLLKALVIAPKSIQDKWKKDLKESGVKADVVTTDGIKKIDMMQYRAIVADEAHNLAAPIFTAERSARVEVFYNFVKEYPKAHILLLSATPVRSKSWNAHTLSTFVGKYHDWRKWRKKFYRMTDTFGRWHFEPVKTWRKDVRPYIEEISDIVLMRDIVEVPKHSEAVIQISWTKADESLLEKHWEAAKDWHARHRAENGRKKFDELEQIMSQYRKVVVVCYYLSQIEDYKKWIGDDREVFVMTGATKDQGAVIQAAQEADDAILLIQASLGAGFDLDTFSMMVFASMDFRYVSLVQMKARINRIHNLHSNRYVYLIGGKADAAVYETLQKGKDFDPISYRA